jgi:hypothetical protein
MRRYEADADGLWLLERIVTETIAAAMAAAEAKGRAEERKRIADMTRERGVLIREEGQGLNRQWNDHWALLASHADEIAEGITIEEIRARGAK